MQIDTTKDGGLVITLTAEDLKRPVLITRAVESSIDAAHSRLEAEMYEARRAALARSLDVPGLEPEVRRYLEAGAKHCGERAKAHRDAEIRSAAEVREAVTGVPADG